VQDEFLLEKPRCLSQHVHVGDLTWGEMRENESVEENILHYTYIYIYNP
jgi:hypothetical protein